MSRAGRNRGRDGRRIPTVDIQSEAREVERRREAWAAQQALREQIKRFARDDQKKER